MSSFPPRTKSVSPLGSDEFRIEFEDDVLPAPVSRLNPPARVLGDEEDFELQLARTQEELLNLQNQARVVERRKEELEEVTRKEREYARGRSELHEKLSGKLVTLERASTETQRQLETLLQARDDISRHYRALTSIVIEDWHAPGVVEQADHALAVINEARADYERICARTTTCLSMGVQAGYLPADVPMVPAHDFRYWLFSGLAFTLPLFVLGAAAIVLSVIF